MLVLIGLLLIAAPTDAKRTIIRPDSGRAIATSVQAGPLILADANTVVHVVWNGSAMVPLIGPAWTMNGTIPQVPRAGKTPAGAGPYSDANFYSLGTGNDVLDFAGDFSACLVFAVTSGANSPVLFSNGTVSTNGWIAQNASAGGDLRVTFSTAGVASPTVDTFALPSGLNVVCVGRAAATGQIKANLRALVTGSAGTITAATGTPARLGRYPSAGFALNGTLYEAWFSTTTPSDALFTAIANRVKSRAGVTAW